MRRSFDSLASSGRMVAFDDLLISPSSSSPSIEHVYLNSEFSCPLSNGLIEWHEFWHSAFVKNVPEYRKAWNKGEEQEKATGHTFRSKTRDTWPASMEGLRLEFEKGRIPRDTRKDKFGELKCRVCRS